MPDESPDVWQNVVDLYADIDRIREEYGPFLRELRCTLPVRAYLDALIGRAETQPFVPRIIGSVPLILDAGIPAGALRFVYDDGSTRDIQALAAVRYEVNTDGLFDIPFPSFRGADDG
jgi:hypothetical protein